MFLSWRVWLAACFAPLACLLLFVVPSQAETPIRYEVRKGDTLYALAQEHFRRPSDMIRVQRINRISDPRRMQTGRILVIPRSYLRYQPLNAKIQAFRGSVLIRRAGSGATTNAVAGMTLEEGDRIRTAPAGFVTLAVDGGVRTTLPSSSAVILQRLRRYSINGEVERVIALQEGRGDIDASGLRRKGSKGGLEVRTPNATAAIRGTEFSVAVLSGGTSVSVHEGKVDVSGNSKVSGQSADLPEVNVDGGFGVAVSEEGLSPPIKLLDAPEQVDPRRLKTGQDVRFDLKPVAGAGTYRFRLGTDAGMIDSVAEVDSTLPTASFANLEDGNYFLRVSAVDAHGLEGMSRTYPFRRLLSTMDGLAPGFGDDGKIVFRWMAEGEGGPSRFILAGDREVTKALLDRPGIDGTEIVLEGLPPGTYYWVIERRLVADGEVEIIRSTAQELVVAAQ
ncbi:MAG: FecR domain-containing protein [Sphingomonadaceae bacterium]